MFTDVYKMELVNDLFYKIQGKFIIEDSSVDDSVFGSNKSAEVEEEEEGEDNAVTIPDIVAASKLKQVPTIVTKKTSKITSRPTLEKWWIK
eukprot:UN16576